MMRSYTYIYTFLFPRTYTPTMYTAVIIIIIVVVVIISLSLLLFVRNADQTFLHVYTINNKEWIRRSDICNVMCRDLREQIIWS